MFAAMDVSFNDLRSRIDANDIGWFKERYRSGDLAFLRGRLPAGAYEELGKKVEAGDLGWVQNQLSGAGFLGGLANQATSLGGATAGIAMGAAGAPAGAMGAASGFPGGAANAGTTLVAPPPQEERKGRGAAWLWIIPVIAAVAIAALALRACGNSDDEVGTTGAASTSEAAVATSAKATPSTAAAKTTVADAATGSILDVAKGAGDFTVLTGLIDKAGLGTTLSGKGPFTVFAPTDDAFAKVDKSVLDGLAADKDALTKVLSYHVAEGSLSAADLASGKLPSLAGSNLTIAVDGKNVRVNDATVTTADLPARNGVIHVIDRVLLPPDLDLAKLGGGAGATTTTGATTTSTTVDTATTATTADTATTTTAATATTAPPAAAPAKFTVFFNTDAIDIRPSEQATIDQAIAAIKARPAGTKVSIVGFADPRGDVAVNQLLSEGRAESVKAALSAAVPNATYTVEAKGDTNPSDDLQQSRRVEITIS